MNPRQWKGQKALGFRFLMLGICIGIGVAATSCRHSEPSMIFMPDMAYGPAKRAQSPGMNRMPVKGTVPREGAAYPYGMADAEKAGKELQNPLTPTHAVMERGKDRFETYCLVCHGPSGEGDGSIIPKFPRPPTLHSDKVRGWTDGRIFHVITMGQGLMAKYAMQVPTEDRWAIIHYIRALQKAKNPSADDVNAAKSAGEVR